MKQAEVYERTLQKWKRSPKGIVIYNNDELSLYRVSLLLCSKVLKANPKADILIITPNSNSIDTIATEVAKDSSLAFIIDSIKIKDSTIPLAITNVTLLIVISPEKFKNANSEYLSAITYKYSFIVSNEYMVKDMFAIPVIENITTHNTNIASSDIVKQYNFILELSDNDKEKYENYTNFISDTIAIFEDIDVIFKCMGPYGVTHREQLAINKGWSRDLDLTKDEQGNYNDYYASEINRHFSPHAIYERCKSFNEIVSYRNKLIQDNELKLSTTLDIIKKYPKSKIGIINKNSLMAIKYTDTINKVFSNNRISDVLFGDYIEERLLRGNCVNFNNKLETIVLDIKSKNGKNKVLGSTKQNKLSNDLYNRGRCNITSFSNSVPVFANFEFDIIIFTSPECNSLQSTQIKVDKFKLKSEGIIIYLYFDDSKKEVEKLNQLSILNKNKIINIKNVADIEK